MTPQPGKKAGDTAKKAGGEKTVCLFGCMLVYVTDREKAR